MIQRVIDPRIVQAQAHGIIVGLPKSLAEQIAVIADVLEHVQDWIDIIFMFEEDLGHRSGSTWAIQIQPPWSVLFEWQPPWGAINIRLN